MLRSLSYLAFNSIRIIRTIAQTRDALATSPSRGPFQHKSESSRPGALASQAGATARPVPGTIPAVPQEPSDASRRL
jgi:hypothetical protein